MFGNLWNRIDRRPPPSGGRARHRGAAAERRRAPPRRGVRRRARGRRVRGRALGGIHPDRLLDDGRPPPRTSLRASPVALAPERAQRRPERLAAAQHRLVQVAVLLDALERDRHREVARADRVGQLLPAERRRDGRAGLRAHGVDRRDRLAVAVLAVVDEHALALLLQPLGRDLAGCSASSRRDSSSANS